MAISDWSITASANKSVGSIGIDEGMAPGDVDGAIREIMAQIAANYQTQAAAFAAAIALAQGYANTAASSLAAVGVYTNAYATSLPQGLAGITIGGTAITGATPGTYALTPVGGSLTGVAANLVVDTSTTAHIVITNPGLGTGTTPPTFANPAGATLPSGTTLTGVVGPLVPTQGGYWAVTSDSLYLARYLNDGTSTPAAVNAPNGAQVKVPLKTLLDQISGMVGTITSSASLDTSRTVASVKDGAGSFLTGTLKDGRQVKARSLTRPRLTEIVDGNGYRQIEVCDGLSSNRLTAGLYNNWAPEWVRGDTISFQSDRRGTAENYTMASDGSAQTAPATLVWEHWQGGGQSYFDGTNGAASGAVGLALTTTNATPQAYMLTTNGGIGSYGPRPMLDDSNGVANVDRFTQCANVPGLELLREAVPTSTIGGTNCNGETPCSGFAAQYMKGADSSQRMVMDVWARGSAAWKQSSGSTAPNVELHPGSFHYANKHIHQSLVRKYVEAGGSWGAAGRYVYKGEIIFHGQADATNLTGSGVPTPQATYKQYLSDWAAANNRHSRTRSRYQRGKRIWINQLSVMTTGLPGAFGIACAQQQAAASDPLVVCFGPGYQGSFNSDNLHPQAAHLRQMAEVAGKWVRRIEREKKAIPQFFPTKCIINGATFTFQYIDGNGRSLLPWGLSIVLDGGVNVASVANSGLKFYDGAGNTITISTLAVTSDGQGLTGTLSGTPNLANNPYFTFGDASTGNGTAAGKTSGARTNIRNAETELGVLSGLPLYDWHLHGQIYGTAS